LIASIQAGITDAAPVLLAAMLSAADQADSGDRDPTG
jgi:hypothetical protein